MAGQTQFCVARKTRVISWSVSTFAREAVGHGDCVHIGRAQGHWHQRARSPILGKTIAMALIDVTHAAVGTDNDALDGQQKRLPAVITPLHYDPQKTRPRM